MQDAAGDRVNLQLADGSVMRVALPFAPLGLLTQLVIGALGAALPPATFQDLHSRLLPKLGKSQAQPPCAVKFISPSQNFLCLLPFAPSLYVSGLPSNLGLPVGLNHAAQEAL